MNSAFDEKYDIRQARYDEIGEIMDFIGNYWRKGHILAVNRDFFEYEFVKNEEVNCYIAKNKETGEIEGLRGYLFASSDTDKLDAWGVLWKVRKDHSNMPFLGVELLERMLEDKKIRHYMSVGANPKTTVQVLTRLFNYKAAKMKHYYRLADRKDYAIAKIQEKVFIKNDENVKQCEMKEIYSMDELCKNFDFALLDKNVPYKDKNYYEHRFFNHPIYKYRFFVLNEAFFVAREQEMNNSKVLRIVDYAGVRENFSGLHCEFEKLLSEFEYIDFYNLGFEDEFLKKAGFINKEETPENIIPNYFSPFVQENIDIYVAYNAENCVFYKGDSDQDRPN